MPAAPEQSADRFTFNCARCQRLLAARAAWVGRQVACPHCSSVQRVPSPSDDSAPAPPERLMATAPLQFNFGCPRCETLLEAHTGLCGQPARCPTCGARLLVPSFNPQTGLTDEAGLLDAERQDPTPVHAYAASGEQAPGIQRRPDGTLVIVCPRCGACSPIDADGCPSCGAPFTMEAAPVRRAGGGSAYGTVALVLGVVALPLFILLIPAGLAVVFGVLGLRSSAGRISTAGVAGMVLGLMSLLAGLAYWVAR